MFVIVVVFWVGVGGVFWCVVLVVVVFMYCVV